MCDLIAVHLGVVCVHWTALMTSHLTAAGVPATVEEHHDQIEQYWRNHRITRRSALRNALLGAGAIALVNFPALKRTFAAAGGVSGPSGAVLVGRHIAFANSGRNTPMNSMRITTQAVFPGGVNTASVTAFVRFGKNAAYGSVVAADIVNLTGVVPNSPQGTLAGNQFYVKVLLTGLKAGKTYHYRVELSDGTMTGDGTFTTAPDRDGLGLSPTPGVPVPRPFTFTSFGDHGTNTPPTDPPFAYAGNTPYTWAPASFDDNYYSPTDPVLAYDPRPAETMTALVAGQNPVFHLMNGDVSYADPSGTGLPVDNTQASGSHGKALPGLNAYNPYTWDVYFAQIEGSASAIPWMVATGNHDMEALYGNHGYGGHSARLDLPQNGPSICPSVYSFVYANVGVISVDANDLSYEITTNTGYSNGAQYAWVDRTLAAWCADSTVDFVVMFMHHCAFSTSGAHASDLGVRQLVGVLSDKYEVDLVLSGHNHQAERTNPIRGKASTAQTPDGTTFDANVGTTYLTVGSAGRPRYLWQNGGTPDTTGASDRYRQHTTGLGATTYYPVTKTYDKPGSSDVEEADWSQTRYLDYALARVDVTPAPVGAKTSMRVTIVADGDRVGPGPSTGIVIDQITMERTAGARCTVTPPPDVPEAGLPVLLPVTAAALIGAGAFAHLRSTRNAEALEVVEVPTS